MIPFRFPDKPTLGTPGILDTLRDGEWLAQFKPDGFRCLIDWDGHWPVLTSRHAKQIPATHALLGELAQSLRRVHPGSVIDAEWMGRRDGQPEGLYLFDLLVDQGCWIGHHGAIGRFITLRTDTDPTERVRIVPWTLNGYAEFFERSKTAPGVEGIVLKRADSKFIGSKRTSVDNPDWIKVKWRYGADGQLPVG